MNYLHLLKTWLVLLVISSACRAQEEYEVIHISDEKISDVKWLRNFSGEPDSTGILSSFTIEIPEFSSGCYYVQDTILNNWPDGANRIKPYPFGSKMDLKVPSLGGFFINFKLTNGKYLAILPLSSLDIASWLNINPKGKLELLTGNLGKEGFKGDVPLFSWSVSDDFYHACYQVWSNLINNEVINSNTKWRSDKEFAELFGYLGWCTWEHFKDDINEEVLLSAGKKIENSGIPIRWILIDDGHQQLTMAKANMRKLISFEPDTVKFPNAWERVNAMRNPEKIKWIGLWLNNQGYFNGISPENKMETLNQYLTRLPSGAYLPADDSISINHFFDSFMKSIYNYGFDFVKIDDQAAALRYYKGTQNPVRTATLYAKARENSVRKYFGANILNCMAHNFSCIFNTSGSAVTRSSIDYYYGKLLSAREHIWQSYNNTLFLGQTVWPDHDMFHSSDTGIGRLMAVSKALAGGPVYISDPPEKFIDEFILPLCFNDGTLLRTLAPAVPTPESAFSNPLASDSCYRVIAPLSNHAAVVVLYNLNEEENKAATGYLNPSDYAFRNGLLQPYPGKQSLPEEGLVLYDWYEKKGLVFSGTYKTILKGFCDKLFIISPIIKGWSVIGRTDKYLSAQAISEIDFTNDALTLTMKESGKLLVYSTSGKPVTNKYQVTDQGNGFYLFNLPEGIVNKKLTITRN